MQIHSDARLKTHKPICQTSEDFAHTGLLYKWKISLHRVMFSAQSNAKRTRWFKFFDISKEPFKSKTLGCTVGLKENHHQPLSPACSLCFLCLLVCVLGWRVLRKWHLCICQTIKQHLCDLFPGFRHSFSWCNTCYSFLSSDFAVLSQQGSLTWQSPCICI